MVPLASKPLPVVWTGSTAVGALVGLRPSRWVTIPRSSAFRCQHNTDANFFSLAGLISSSSCIAAAACTCLVRRVEQVRLNKQCVWSPTLTSHTNGYISTRVGLELLRPSTCNLPAYPSLDYEFVWLLSKKWRYGVLLSSLVLLYWKKLKHSKSRRYVM